jgi:peptidoglycan hydrolase CwlO-like protein
MAQTDDRVHLVRRRRVVHLARRARADEPMSNEPIFDGVVEDRLLPSWARELRAAVRANTKQLAQLTKEIRNMADDQKRLDDDVQQLEDAEASVEAELAALKAQPAAQGLDFTKLEAAVQRIQLDAPVAAPAAPAAPAPADPTAPAAPADPNAPAPAA